MEYYSKQINQLIQAFSSLPGIGTKSAQRLAFHVINMPEEQVKNLAKTMVDARQNVCYCAQCCTLTDQEVCPICKNPSRDQKTIMVVETPGIWRLTKRPGNTRGSIMSCTGPSPPCSASGREISG